MQYKIPQNVRREDKIVGPLTLKQLIYLGIGGGLTYAVYTILARNYFIEVWLLPTAFLGLTTLAITFLKINGIPFSKWMMLGVEYMYNPKKRIFVMGAGDVYAATIFAKKKKKVEKDPNEITKAERDRKRLQNISEITKLVDTIPHA